MGSLCGPLGAPPGVEAGTKATFDTKKAEHGFKDSNIVFSEAVVHDVNEGVYAGVGKAQKID